MREGKLMIKSSHFRYLRALGKFALTAMLIAILGAGMRPINARAQDALAKDARENLYMIGLQAGNLFQVNDAPIDSMPLVSLYVGRQLSQSLSAVLSLDSFVFDIENTGERLSIPTVGETSAEGRTTFLTPSLNYIFGRIGSPLQPYIRAGVGIGFTDFDNEDDSQNENGTPYDIRTNSGEDVEFMPTVSAGIRYDIKSGWFLDAGARFDYHINNWKIEDRVSGRALRIDNFSAMGAYIGFGGVL